MVNIILSERLNELQYNFIMIYLLGKLKSQQLIFLNRRLNELQYNYQDFIQMLLLGK